MKRIHSSSYTMKRFLSSLVVSVGLVVGLMMANVIVVGALAQDDFVPKPATNLHDDSGGTGKLDGLALDQKNWRMPQSSFKWIAMATGINTSWDSFGRQGWLTDDAYVEPVNPGISEFSPDTEKFYLVFAVSALDAPSQYRAAWYYMSDGKSYDNEVIGTDALMLEMNEKAGYLEVYKPKEGWKKGKYFIKLFFESPGQELYEAQVVGTMKFTITDTPTSPPGKS